MWRAFRRSEKDECSKTRDMLSGYADRRLNPEDAARVEGHLRTCLGCREELESLRATVALLHRLPEVTPSRSFAVAPVRPLPGRRALPALRFATAGVVLLLVLAFAADRTDLFRQNPLSNPNFGPSTLDFGPAKTSEEGEAYWSVAGVKNSVDPDSETPVELVVPDGSDNVVMAVTSLAVANNGVLYGKAVMSYEVAQVVLSEGGEGSGGGGEVEQFTVVPAPVDEESSFATNDAGTTGNALVWRSYMVGQDGPYLNMLNSDNSQFYSFDLSNSRREFKTAPGHDWLRLVQYGLIGLAVILGGATAALWLRQRRQRVAGVGKSQN